MIGERPAVDTSAGHEEEQHDYVEDVDDAAVSAIDGSADSSNPSVTYVGLYIAYSPVYRVPVLYFRARLQGKSTVTISKTISLS